MLLTIGEETFEVNSSNSWSIAGNESNKAEILEDSVAIEVFHSIREEFFE
ncbi:hypothetical protein [Methanococcoides sp. LMO-2]|uniref:Uncharacterized protein n=1 Tax=Methanococcoides cohabitans TaxID=3136559 RepID=A0ABU9KQ92_9EURY